MEIKLPRPHLFAPLNSSNISQDNNRESRGMRVVHYLTRTISGNSSNTQDYQSNSRERMSHDCSDGEDSDEDAKEHGSFDSPLDAAGPEKLIKKEHNATIGHDKSKPNDNTQGWRMGKTVLEASKGVAADLRSSFVRLSQMRDMIIEKLAAIPTIPADRLDHARRSIEHIVSEVTQSAYGKTRDAMMRIRVRLVEVIPSLSPHESKKIVDDVEREVLDLPKITSGYTSPLEKPKNEIERCNVGVSATTTSAPMFSQPQKQISMPTSNVDRIKSWALFRSRL